jgi:predicted O-linked N-acetylglucosamine transferase (SPINDLY family)
MDFTDCLAENPADYVELAVRLGCDGDYRRHISERLNEAKHAVFEDHAAVSEHERIFSELLADVI